MQPDYEGLGSLRNSIMYDTLANTEVTYELPMISNPLSQEMEKSMKAEQDIYDTPFDDEGNYGPLYCEPPLEEQKIYEEFEGKKFRKLCCKDIKLVLITKSLLVYAPEINKNAN